MCQPIPYFSKQDNNRLKKTIPTNIGKLTKLTELVLGKNMHLSLSLEEHILIVSAKYVLCYFFDVGH